MREVRRNARPSRAAAGGSVMLAGVAGLAGLAGVALLGGCGRLVAGSSAASVAPDGSASARVSHAHHAASGSGSGTRSRSASGSRSGSASGSAGAGDLSATPCAALAPHAAWLPATVAGQSSRCATPRGLAAGRVAASEVTSVVTEYHLAGSINADTVSANYRTGHPATSIVVVSYPRSSTAPDPTDGGQLSGAVRTVTLGGGVVAQVLTPPGGYGAVRIGWTRGGNSYLLVAGHLHTAQGTSGVPTAGLLRLAAGLG